MHVFVKNSILLTVFTVLVLPLSYFVRLFLSQELSITEYGLFYAILGFFGLIQSLNDLGFSETQLYFIPKYLSQDRLDKVKAVFKVQLLNQILTTFVIGAILWFLAPWVSETVFHTPELYQAFRLFIIFFILSDFLTNLQILFFSHQEIQFSGAVEPLRMFFTVAALLVVSTFRDINLLVLGFIWIGVYGLLATIYLITYYRQHKNVFKAQHYSLIKIYKEFIPFILPTLISNNVATLFSKGTETILVAVRGATAAAVYNIAKPISNMALGFTSPIANLLKPFIAQIDEKQNIQTIRKVTRHILTSGTFVLLPFSVILSFYATESVVFLFGESYLAAALPLRIMAFEIFFEIMNTFVFGIVFGLGLQKKRAVLLYITSVISLILSIVLIPRYGPVGVALASLAYGSINMFGAVILIKERTQFSLPVKKLLQLVPLLLVLLLSQVLFKFIAVPQLSFQFVLFILKAAVGLLIYYSLGLYWFKIIDLDEILPYLPTQATTVARAFRLLKT